MIEVQHLCKSYGSTTVVNDVSFSVARGEVLVLLGTSGSGKSTTLKMINKLVEKDKGKIFIQSEDTDQLAAFELRRKIGYVIQNVGLFPHYTVEENIAVVPRLLGWTNSQVKNRVTELLQMMGLPAALRTRQPAALSGGQQQRVGIARALAGDPDLILLDEPFGALDPITRHELQKEFKQLEGGLDKAMVLITHDVAEAVTLGDRICLMDQGRVQQTGTPKQLIFQPENEFVAQFLGHQRLQLELHVITLQDLAPYLIHQKEQPCEILLPAKSSLAVCIEKCDGKKSYGFIVSNRQYIFNFDALLKIYFTHRRELITAIGGTY